MPKQTQSKSLGTVQDFTSTPEPDPETDKLEALEKRITTLEVLLNDIMHQLDQPKQHRRAKTQKTPSNQKGLISKLTSTQKEKPKKTPPSEIIAALLKEKPHSQSEIETTTGMDTEAVSKCINYMRKNNLIESDSQGNYSLLQE